MDRRVHTGFIQKVAELYKQGELNTLTIAPEGTRSKKEHWKTGFYFIALEADVPIVLGRVDRRHQNFDILTQQEGIAPAPYLARYKWVLMERTDVMKADQFSDMLRMAHRLTLEKMSKKKQKELLSR